MRILETNPREQIMTMTSMLGGAGRRGLRSPPPNPAWRAVALLLLLVLLQLASAMGLLRSAQLCFESLALLCIVLGVHGEGDQSAVAIKRTATATLSSSSASASASANASVSTA
jgi:hypothetical protein